VCRETAPSCQDFHRQRAVRRSHRRPPVVRWVNTHRLEP
jgi:hypothetical protein